MRSGRKENIQRATVMSLEAAARAKSRPSRRHLRWNWHRARYRLNVMKHGTARAGAAILAAGVAAGTTGCADQSPLRCSTRPAALSASLARARPGEIVTLTAHRLPRDRLVIMQNPGSLGTASDGQFTAIYDLGAATHGTGRHPSYRKAEGGSVAGTGLPSRPFDIEVPPVPAGNYIIQFDYSAAPASPSTSRPEQYTLCGTLQVSH